MAAENFLLWRQRYQHAHAAAAIDGLEDEDTAMDDERSPWSRLRHCDGFEIRRRVLPPTTLGRGVMDAVGDGRNQRRFTIIHILQQLQHTTYLVLSNYSM